MTTFICLAYFVVLTGIGIYFLSKSSGVITVPFNTTHKMRCTGLELLLIFIFSTGLIGLIPVLSLRLAVLEVLCIIGIIKGRGNISLSFPLIVFSLFLLWILSGIIYTPNKLFGLRMFLKYLYPFLLAILASIVVKNREIFLKAALNARWMALFAIIITLIPNQGYIFQGVFWNAPAMATNFICMCMFSLGMAYASNKKIKNILWVVLFMLPCILWVLRTDIFGLGLALSAFFFIKYKIRALPLILVIGCIGLAVMFYIPSVKAKMYYRPNEVTVVDFLSGNIDENNINTSGRKKGWEDVQRWFFDNHELMGSGTGRVQTYFYTEAIGWQRGGQLHNDFLVLLCDNGIIGFSLFIITYLSILFHCLIIYHKSVSNIVKLCAITAGSSLIGILVTMYSDNTISYSMATLGYPWGFYGMALGLMKGEYSDK